MRDLGKLLRYLFTERTDVLEVRLEQLEHFAASLADLGISARSMARILSGVRQFYRWLVLDGYLKADPTVLLESPKQPAHLPEVLSTAEVDMLESAIDLAKWEGQRNKAIIEVLFSCGLRVSELVNLKFQNLFVEERYLRILGKGSKERLVPISQRAIDELMLWNADRNAMHVKPGEEDYVFLNRRGHHLTRTMVLIMVKQYARAAGIQKTISPTPCATVLPRPCSKAEPTCVSSRPCWAMKVSVQQRSIPISTPPRCARRSSTTIPATSSGPASTASTAASPRRDDRPTLTLCLMSQPLTHSFPLLLPTVLLLLGIVFAGWVGWSVGVWVASLSATLIVLFLCRRHPKASNFLILTALFQLGAWLSAQAEAGLHRLLPKEKVCYEAVVMSEPVPRGKVVRFDMAVLQHQGKPLLVKAQLLRDTISHRYDRLHVGDGLRAVSILETPQSWAASTFDYARWLRLHGFSAQTFLLPSNWQKARVSLQPLGWWNRLVLQARQVRQHLLDRYRQWQIGGDETAVVAALSLGDKSGLSKRLRDDYSRAGVAHVLALSGLHLGILCGLFSLFSRRRSGRWLSSLLTLTCAWPLLC